MEIAGNLLFLIIFGVALFLIIFYSVKSTILEAHREIMKQDKQAIHRTDDKADEHIRAEHTRLKGFDRIPFYFAIFGLTDRLAYFHKLFSPILPFLIWSDPCICM